MYVTNNCKEVGLIAGIVTASNIKITESDDKLKSEIEKLINEKQKEENIYKLLVNSFKNKCLQVHRSPFLHLPL